MAGHLERRADTNSTDLYFGRKDREVRYSSREEAWHSSVWIGMPLSLCWRHFNCDLEIIRRGLKAQVRLKIELVRNPRNRFILEVVDPREMWYVTAHSQVNFERISQDPVALDLQGTSTCCCFEIAPALFL